MAIQQHPLPQDISSYRFRLIGDMTLKQFTSLGVCVIIALIFYSLPLPFFFKYPLVFLFVLLGIGMAFIPIQGRSLDAWLIAFIKSIYSPTQYTWKRNPVTPLNLETALPTNGGQSTPIKPTTNTSPEKTTPLEVPMPSSESEIPKQKPLYPTDLPKLSPPASTQPPATSTPTTPQTPAPTTNLPIPFTPTTPNTLVGLTLTPSGHILDGVLIEIKKDNLTLRATKSNKLGQFMFARPLDSGLFQILAEKEGFSFSPYSLELTGEIVKPLKLQAL